MQAMETPLVMSGFHPEAIRLWQQKMAGTGLETVAAGGMGGASQSSAESAGGADAAPSAKAIASIVPGSAVSAQLVRGDLEIAATCTVTYIDPKQLLACGHPILAGRAGFAAHDHGRGGRHAGFAAERLQDYQYRRDRSAPSTRTATRPFAASWGLGRR